MVKNGYYYDVVTLYTTGQPLVNHYVTYWTPQNGQKWPIEFLRLFGLLIQFKSINSTVNGQKRFLL